jgi:hypothetical protein
VEKRQLTVFTGSVPFRGGAIFQFYDRLSPPVYLFLVAVERGPAGVDFYRFALEGPFRKVARVIDDAGPGAQIALSTTVGSGQFLTLAMFDPKTGRLWYLTGSIGEGGYSLLRLGAGVPFAVLVSARADQRLSNGMHGPARRAATLFRSTRRHAATPPSPSGAPQPMCRARP